MGTNAAPDHNLEQLKLLLEYTKFHIGLYSTIAGVLVAALATKHAESWKVRRWAVAAAVAAIVVAGLAGGVVAASIVSMTDVADFWNKPIGPYASELLTVRGWTYVEHSAFWIAVLFVLAAFWPAAFKDEVTVKNVSSGDA
jgi:sulfite exporter TauE/SafE